MKNKRYITVHKTRPQDQSMRKRLMLSPHAKFIESRGDLSVYEVSSDFK